MKITSYNLHVYDIGYPHLKSLCSEFDIIPIQEHWLQSSQLYKLGLIDNNFSYNAVSAMDHKSQCGFLRGRPFGGVGILQRKTFSRVIERISKDTEGRAITIKLNVNIDSQNLLITCVYFPCAGTPVAYNPSVGPIFMHILMIFYNHFQTACI